MNQRRFPAMLAAGTSAGLISILVGYSLSPYAGWYGFGLEAWLSAPEHYVYWLVIGFAAGSLGSLALHLWTSR